MSKKLSWRVSRVTPSACLKMALSVRSTSVSASSSTAGSPRAGRFRLRLHLQFRRPSSCTGGCQGGRLYVLPRLDEEPLALERVRREPDLVASSARRGVPARRSTPRPATAVPPLRGATRVPRSPRTDGAGSERPRGLLRAGGAGGPAWRVSARVPPPGALGPARRTGSPARPRSARSCAGAPSSIPARSARRVPSRRRWCRTEGNGGVAHGRCWASSPPRTPGRWVRRARSDRRSRC